MSQPANFDVHESAGALLAALLRTPGLTARQGDELAQIRDELATTHIRLGLPNMATPENRARYDAEARAALNRAHTIVAG